VITKSCPVSDLKKIRVALKGSLFDREKQITQGKRRRFIGSTEEIASKPASHSESP